MNGKKLVNVIAVVILVLAAFFVGQGFSPVEDTTLESETEIEKGTVNLLIDLNEKGVKSFEEVQIEKGDSLEEVLLTLDEEGLISIEGEDFGGELGYFVEAIDGVGGDDSGRWWQYWVNGEYAEVGVSAYVVQAGDSVVFLYTKGQEDEFSD